MSSQTQPGGTYGSNLAEQVSVDAKGELVMEKVPSSPIMRRKSRFDAVVKEYLTCKVGESLLVTIPDGIHMQNFASGVRSLCNVRGHVVPSVHIDKVNRQIEFRKLREKR